MQHGGRASISCEKVGSPAMSSVLSDAHVAGKDDEFSLGDLPVGVGGKFAPPPCISCGKCV